MLKQYKHVKKIQNELNSPLWGRQERISREKNSFRRGLRRFYCP